MGHAVYTHMTKFWGVMSILEI